MHIVSCVFYLDLVFLVFPLGVLLESRVIRAIIDRVFWFWLIFLRGRKWIFELAFKGYVDDSRISAKVLSAGLKGPQELPNLKERVFAFRNTFARFSEFSNPPKFTKSSTQNRGKFHCMIIKANKISVCRNFSRFSYLKIIIITITIGKSEKKSYLLKIEAKNKARNLINKTIMNLLRKILCWVIKNNQARAQKNKKN